MIVFGDVNIERCCCYRHGVVIGMVLFSSLSFLPSRPTFVLDRQHILRILLFIFYHLLSFMLLIIEKHHHCYLIHQCYTFSLKQNVLISCPLSHPSFSSHIQHESCHWPSHSRPRHSVLGWGSWQLFEVGIWILRLRSLQWIR